jgi:uncharacterized protein (DUF1697 family)
MHKLITFLRAINVGGHTVKMDELRRIFESIGFSGVETFIASGNVIFDTTVQPGRALEQRIEDRLREALGYPVAAFLRTPAELAAIACYQAFPQPAFNAASAYNVAFLSTEPNSASVNKLMAFRTEIDDFSVHGREVYWLCQVRQSQSTFSNAVLERALGMPSTLRSISTIRKLAEKYPS